VTPSREGEERKLENQAEPVPICQIRDFGATSVLGSLRFESTGNLLLVSVVGRSRGWARGFCSVARPNVLAVPGFPVCRCPDLEPITGESGSDEANLSAESSQEKAEARFSQSNEHKGGTRVSQSQTGEGSKAAHRLRGIEVGVTISHSGRFRRADRVVSARDYKRLRRCGTRLSSKNFSVSVAPRKTVARDLRYERAPSAFEARRLGITVSRRVGNAVARNRVKRSIREWFRLSRQNFASNVDIVVIGRPGAADRTPLEIRSELQRLLESPRGQAVTAAAGDSM
jgi:ribonuclease P protein component